MGPPHGRKGPDDRRMGPPHGRMGPDRRPQERERGRSAEKERKKLNKQKKMRRHGGRDTRAAKFTVAII